MSWTDYDNNHQGGECLGRKAGFRAVQVNLMVNKLDYRRCAQSGNMEVKGGE